MQYRVIHLKDEFSFLGDNGKDPVVTIYSPTNMDIDKCRDAKRPCLVICPGGGYSRISPRESEPLALDFLSLGYHTFILDYTPGPEHNFPTQLVEVAAVLELIHQKTDEWLLDAERVAIMGFSAGGHLAAHYSNAYNWPEVRVVFSNSHPVHACILGYPVISADETICHHGSFATLLGKEPSEEEKIRFSCENMVTEQTPPTFLWHTAADQSVPVENSLVYAKALAEHDVPFEVHIFPFGRHGLGNVKNDPAKIIPPEAFPNKQWIQLAHNWLNITFGIE